MTCPTARGLALGLVLLAGAGCSASPAEAPPSGSAPPADAPPLGRYTDVEQVRNDLEVMLGKLGADRQQVEELVRAFRALLARPEVKKAADERGISATCASVGRTGGLIVGIREGHGLVSFPKGRQGVRVDVSGWTVGATIGGARTFNVGIAIGLSREADLVGAYDVRIHGGAAGPLGERSGSGRPEAGTHELHWVGTVVGFGGDVSGGKITIAWEDGQ